MSLHSVGENFNIDHWLFGIGEAPSMIWYDDNSCRGIEVI